MHIMMRIVKVLQFDQNAAYGRLTQDTTGNVEFGLTFTSDKSA